MHTRCITQTAQSHRAHRSKAAQKTEPNCADTKPINRAQIPRVGAALRPAKTAQSSFIGRARGGQEHGLTDITRTGLYPWDDFVPCQNRPRNEHGLNRD